MTPSDFMRLLWIATKPPLPTTDGGRLVATKTLSALADASVDIDLVAPIWGEDPTPIERDLASFCRPHLVPVPPPPLSTTAWRALRIPLSIVRHSYPQVRDRIDRLLTGQTFDAVHAEQLQAFAQAAPAGGAGVPVVLRAQNVESDLWRQAARWAPWEARRLAAYERGVVRQAAATIALSARDASRLAELAGADARIVAVPPPFPETLPAGERPLEGEPPLVLMGSAGWRPNRDANKWFVDRCWPEVLARVPGAVLHIFAAEPDRRPLPGGVVAHAPPVDSAEAFPTGSILVVPLRVGSGVRMKVLEAWARGVCVVATPEAVAGLAARDGEESLLPREASGFAGSIQRLVSDPELRQRLITGGRRRLTEYHDPRSVAARLMSVYTSIAR